MIESGDTKKNLRTESINTETQNAVTLNPAHTCTNKNGVKQGGSVWAWLLVVLSVKIFLVKGTVLAKKKPICAEMKINT